MGFVTMVALLDRPVAFGLMLLNLVRGMARSIITMALMLAEQDTQLHKIYSRSSGVD